MSMLSLRRKEISSSSATSAKKNSSTIVTDDGVDDPRGLFGLNLLYSPSEPSVDIIFVHGLGGGSRKTWSKTSSVTHYWPQEWLPKDPAFKDVRIYSFGYDSNWAKGRESCFNVHHFGKSLLGELWHSMGGLVIKKAHILARQDIGCEKLADRLHSIYFLATPHRGSDLAKYLDNLLQIAGKSREYVTDLKRGSAAVQSINDDFRNYSDNIGLWSFYETQKLKVGMTSTLIVDPESATLGYRAEKQMPMNADHRSICKFDTPQDNNYVVLRNSLARTVQNIVNSGHRTRESLRHQRIRDLERYLDVPENLEDDLANLEETRLSGTCAWFQQKQSYRNWIGFKPGAPRVLWISGKPAAGKSVLASYVIDQLKQGDSKYSYFFFKYNDKTKSRLSSCLRSLAFQMACSSHAILEKIGEMQREDERIDHDNERSLWRKLFLSGIFQVDPQIHYWVIDGLDECMNLASSFDSMLASLDESTPLQIFVTSREVPELEKKIVTLGNIEAQIERISTVDTIADIRALAESKSRFVPFEDDKARAALIDKVVSKSEGTFLWTALVLDALKNVYGEEEIEQALKEMPQHMGPIYHRILETMTHAAGGKGLAKAVLTWTTCAVRPLTTDELGGALKIDVKDRFPGLEESIRAVCGQLVTTDKSGKVQMIHGTARDYLLDEHLISEFAVNKTEAHTRMAKACLTYLTGNEMKPPRTSKRGSAMDLARQRAEFSKYACTAFSYHLAKADPFANDVLALTDKFLRSHVLSWIEVVAETKNLSPLIRAAKNLRIFFNACAIARSPLGVSMKTIEGWSTDFVRIVAKFGDALTLSPSAIYALVPPFCPSKSSIRNTFNSGRGIAVMGISNIHWDDRLSCIDFRECSTSAISYGDQFLAVGLVNGKIVAYHATSYQEFKVMLQHEAVKHLRFGTKPGLLASCGIKEICLWDIFTGTMLHRFQASARILDLAFVKRSMVAALSNNKVSTWDVYNEGCKQPDKAWIGLEDVLKAHSGRIPCAVTLSASHRMLAAAYDGRGIILWDVEEDAYYGECGKKLANGDTSTFRVTALVFNPNPNIELLAASYLDGDLVLLDPFSDQQIECLRANCHTLAASSDGRFLAGGAGGGEIQVYEFDTLKLLYRVRSSDFFIKQLAFREDGLHLADVRGLHCNVWEPAILLRDSISDDVSDATSTTMVDMVALDRSATVSALCLHPKEDIVFVGKEDGSVALFELKPAGEVRGLYRHKTLVRIITWWDRSDTIVSVDASNGVIAWGLNFSFKGGWVSDRMQFQSRVDHEKPILQLLSGEAAGKFILSTRQSDHMWDMEGCQQSSRSYEDNPEARKWIQHHQSSLHMTCIEATFAHVYAWEDWSRVISVDLIAHSSGLQLKNVIPFVTDKRPGILVELSQLDGSPETRALYNVNAAALDLERNVLDKEISKEDILDRDNDRLAISRQLKAVSAASVEHSLPQLANLTRVVAHIIGLRNTNEVVFLDTKSWVCSADIGSLGNGSSTYSRHFFMPYDWFAGVRYVVGAVTQRDVIFACHNDVAFIKGGLQQGELVNLISG